MKNKKSLTPIKVFETINKKLIDYAKPLLIISILCIILGTLLASQLTIKSNMEDMLPLDNEVLKQTNLFNAYFSSNETTVVVIEDRTSSDSTDARSFLSAFEQRLESADYITNSLFYIDLSKLNQNVVLYKDMEFYQDLDFMLNNQDYEEITTLLQDLKQDNTSLHEYFESETSNVYIVFLKPKLTNDFTTSRDNFYNGVTNAILVTQKETNTEHLNVGLTGGAFIQDIEADAVAFDGLFSTFMLTLIIILLFILFSFKQILLPLSTSLPLLGGAILAGSFAYIVYGSLNMFSVSFAILLLGLGIDFGVHILSRYQEEKTKHLKKDALLIALNTTGPSILLGCITTSFAFYAFVIGKFRAFEQMGVISGTGILLLGLMMFTMMPGLILLIDRDHKNHSLKITKFSIGNIIKPFIQFAINKPYIMPIFSILIIVLLSIFVLDTKIVGDISKIYPAEIQSLELAKTVEEAFDYNTNTISIYVKDINKLESITKQLEANDYIKDTSSILDFLPDHQDEKLQILSSLTALSPELSFDKITYEDLDSKIISSYVGKDQVFLIEIIPSVDLYQPLMYETIKDQIYNISGVYPIGMPVIMNEIVLLVTKDVITISILCLTLIFIMLFSIYKNILDSIITLLPLLLSLYTTVGVMNLLNIDINIFSIAAFPLIIGIGIDSSIHLMHRLREIKSHFTIDALIHTGQAIFITSMTTIIGFSSLTRINHPGMANLGFAVAIGMSICLVYTLLLLPSLYKIKSK